MGISRGIKPKPKSDIMWAAPLGLYLTPIFSLSLFYFSYNMIFRDNYSSYINSKITRSYKISTLLCLGYKASII